MVPPELQAVHLHESSLGSIIHQIDSSDGTKAYEQSSLSPVPSLRKFFPFCCVSLFEQCGVILKPEFRKKKKLMEDFYDILMDWCQNMARGIDFFQKLFSGSFS